MDYEEALKRNIAALTEFVERASKKGATKKEVEDLPKVALALAEFLKIS